MTTFDDMLAAAASPAPVVRTPAGWTPMLEQRADGTVSLVTRAYPVAAGLDHDQVIRDHGMDPAQWRVVTFRSSQWQAANGADLAATRLTLVPVGTAGVDDVDLEALQRAARRSKPRPPKPTREGVTLVVSLADLQVGKSDHRGGTAELFERLEDSRAAFARHARRVKPEHILLLDLGDAIENFENTLQQSRTNDLQLTQQIRLWRRVFFSWVQTCAAAAPTVTVAAVPSNHCRVRRGKQAVAGPSDDYGLEVLNQVMDLCAVAEGLQHVEFAAPSEHDESLAVRLPGGKTVGVTHGHLFRSSDRSAQWWSGQALGGTAVGEADLLFYGHHHHARIEAVSDTRWSFGAPTVDAGSAWWRNISGRDSAPAIMVVEVDSTGWSGLTYL